jgi:hypothetical protein
MQLESILSAGDFASECIVAELTKSGCPMKRYVSNSKRSFCRRFDIPVSTLVQKEVVLQPSLSYEFYVVISDC